MFCKNCGKEIDDNAVVCPNCGVATEKMAQSQPVPSQKNTIALVGFILSLVCGGLISLILSIIGLKNAKKPEYAEDGKGFAIAGIVISSIELVGFLIILIFYGSIFGAALGGLI